VTTRGRGRRAAAQVDRELRDLRRRLDAVPRGRGRHFPAPLRARVVAWVAAQRARGIGWPELARALGVPAPTLEHWTTSRPAQGHGVALRRVDVIDEPPRRTVTVVSPSGLRIEGVTIADVIAILRGLS
jgi:hypothetical protein